MGELLLILTSGSDDDVILCLLIGLGWMKHLYPY